MERLAMSLLALMMIGSMIAFLILLAIFVSLTLSNLLTLVAV